MTSTPSSPTSGSFYLKLLCDACKQTFSNKDTLYRCVECHDPPVFLCRECFGFGAQFENHLRTHQCRSAHVECDSYLCDSTERFNDKLSLNAIMRFFEALRRFGFNWERVSGVMPFYGRQRIFTYGACESLYNEICKQLFKKEPQNDRFSISLDQPSPAVPAGIPAESGGPANYNFNRKEFEYDFLPEAEVLLADAHPEKVDHLLIDALHAYNEALDERQRRRDVLVAMGMVSVKDFVPKKRKLEEKEIYEKLRIFVRPAKELGGLGVLESLATGLANERKLRNQLNRLNLLRRNGVTDEKNGEIFDIDIKRREVMSGPNKAIYVYHAESEKNKKTNFEISSMTGAEFLSPEDKSMAERTGVTPQHFECVRRVFKELRKATWGSNSHDTKHMLPTLTSWEHAFHKTHTSSPPLEAYSVVKDAVIGGIWRAQGRRTLTNSEVRDLKRALVDHIWNTL